LIIKFDKNWKILMGLNNWDIYPFNIYVDKTYSEPSKIINVNISTKSFTESKTKFATENTNSWVVENKSLVIETNWWYDNTNSWTIKTDSWTTKIIDSNVIKKSSEIKISSVKSQIWLSGTYYISGSNLNIKTSSWEIKTLYSYKDADLYDFVLLKNKQIKVSYYPLNSKVLEEKIIDVK
jgi:post-segregation antitoxin (ccd killing protein)